MAWKKALVLVAVAAAMMGLATAQSMRFSGFGDGGFLAHLSGDQEVPGVDTQGTGQVLVGLNEDGTRLKFKLVVARIDGITQSHIHCGPAGMNGPVVVFLFGLVSSGVTVNGILAEGSAGPMDVIPRPDSAACPGGIADLDDLIAKMEAGQAYVNVHTVEHQGGEIRGQLKPLAR